MKNILKIVFILLSILVLQGCFSVKPSKTGKAKKVYETFYAGDKGDLYFIKPLLFEGKQKAEQSFWDFSFHGNEDRKAEVITNFSLYASEPIRKIESVEFSNQKYSFEVSQVDFMFVERKKEQIISRFTLKADVQNIKNFFSEPNCQIKIKYSEKIENHLPIQSTKKKIKVLNDTLFVLFF